jgi:solute carrier family 45, member 1/2/4
MLGLASTKPVLQVLVTWVGGNPHNEATRLFIILSAIGWLYSLKIFVQPLQAGIRALIVDSCPADQQTQASAWASRITGVGNIVGYSFGFVPVRNLLPFLEITQFAWLAIVASILLLSTVAMTCIFIREPDPKTLPLPNNDGKSVLKTLKYIVWSFKTMPHTVRRVCAIQFFAWMAWFPYLYYITSYVGDLCKPPWTPRLMGDTDRIQTPLLC